MLNAALAAKKNLRTMNCEKVRVLEKRETAGAATSF